MRKLFVVCCLILIAGIVANAQEPAVTPSPTPADTWVKFNSEAGRFSVMLPAKPNERVENGVGSSGAYSMHMFNTNVADGTVYMAVWVDYESKLKLDSTRELELSRDKFVKTLDATLLNSRHTTINGFEALEFAAETLEYNLRSRVFIVGRRPYQIVMAVPKGRDYQDNLNRFFDSFTVKEN